MYKCHCISLFVARIERFLLKKNKRGFKVAKFDLPAANITHKNVISKLSPISRGTDSNRVNDMV